jgi:hypothetical protein
MATLDDLKLLFAEFPREAISWRAQTVAKSGEKALALAYIDARDVMDRLDQIVGPDNWQDRYEFHNARTICYLSIRVEGEWITKADGAGDSDVEAEKGAISDALKRAAVKWGIGRYLYAVPAPWVPCDSEKGTNGKFYWKKWKVDPWTCVRGMPPQQVSLATPHNPETGEIIMPPAAPPPVDETYAPPPRKANGLPEVGWREDGSRTSFWLKNDPTAAEVRKQLQEDAADCHTILALDRLKRFYRGKASELKWNRQFKDVLAEDFGQIEQRILASLDNAQLAEMPLKETLQKSLRATPDEEAAMLDDRARTLGNSLVQNFTSG